MHLEAARHAQPLDGRRDERKNDGFLQTGKLVEKGADYELLAEPLFHPLLKIVIDGKDHPGVGERGKTIQERYPADGDPVGDPRGCRHDFVYLVHDLLSPRQ